jgi:hypothetical protein
MINQSNNSSSHSRWRRIWDVTDHATVGQVVGGIVLAIILALAGVAGTVLFQGKSNNSGKNPISGQGITQSTQGPSPSDVTSVDPSSTPTSSTPSPVATWASALLLRTGDGQYDEDTATMENTRYPQSIMYTQWAAFDGGWVDFNLGRHCSRFRAAIGFDDGSKDHAVADLEILGDGRKLWKTSMKFGDKPRKVNIDVTGVLRLKVGGTYDLDGYGKPGAVLGTPEVVCDPIPQPTES